MTFLSSKLKKRLAGQTNTRFVIRSESEVVYCKNYTTLSILLMLCFSRTPFFSTHIFQLDYSTFSLELFFDTQSSALIQSEITRAPFLFVLFLTNSNAARKINWVYKYLSLFVSTFFQPEKFTRSFESKKLVPIAFQKQVPFLLPFSCF